MAKYANPKSDMPSGAIDLISSKFITQIIFILFCKKSLQTKEFLVFTEDKFHLQS